jgi:HNH endonuclease
LTDAVIAHLDGRFGEAARLIEQANMRPIMEWTWSLAEKNFEYKRPRFPLDSATKVPVAEREKVRMPLSEPKRMLHVRYGYHCCFCGIPVIRKEVRNRLISLYPDAIPWHGEKEIAKHAALYVMEAQYDHVVPHSRGGRNGLENILLTCLPCNYDRGGFTLEEMGLFDPRTRNPVECVFLGWDGLERILL